MSIKKLISKRSSNKKIIIGSVLVFVLSFLYRLPTLGYDFINNDAFHWKLRGYQFGSALTSFNFADTAVTYHPGVPLLWSQFIAIKIYSLLFDRGFFGVVTPKQEFLINNQIQAIVVVLITSILMAILFQKVAKMLGIRFAIITLVILALEPFYIALSRTIHTDALITLFMGISVLYYYSYINEENSKRFSLNALLAGIFAGLALLTKSSALFLIPYFILLPSLKYFYDKNRDHLIKAGVVLLFTIITFLIVWPAMWVNPVGSINLYLFKGIQGIAIEEGHQHIWFGKETSDPGPLFYFVVLIARYSPLVFLTLLIGFYKLAKNKKDFVNNKNLTLIGSLVLYIIFYFLMITLASKKLDRYSLPILVPMTIISTWVLAQILKPRAMAYILAVFIGYRVLLLWGFHPNYLAYYSPIIGGAETGRYIIEPKWLVGYDKVAAYFNKVQLKSDKVVKVAAADFDYLRPFADFEVVNIQNDFEANQADYFVLPAYRIDRNRYYIEKYKLDGVSTIKVGGIDYYYLYRVIRTN